MNVGFKHLQLLLPNITHLDFDRETLLDGKAKAQKFISVISGEIRAFQLEISKIRAIKDDLWNVHISSKMRTNHAFQFSVFNSLLFSVINFPDQLMQSKLNINKPVDEIGPSEWC